MPRDNYPRSHHRHLAVNTTPKSPRLELGHRVAYATRYAAKVAVYSLYDTNHPLIQMPKSMDEHGYEYALKPYASLSLSLHTLSSPHKVQARSYQLTTLMMLITTIELQAQVYI